jgi:ABC-type Fe3+/spermidine/putrescine transport system ATPase subunit
MRSPPDRTRSGADLCLAGLKKAYGPTPAVRGLSLDVAGGSMVSLIGPSGCGKTTTLRMIAGLEQADEGTITAGGRLISDGPRTVPPEARDMGMVFQSYALWPHMTVTQNVAYGLIRRKYPRSEIGRKVEAVLGIVGIAAYAQRYPGQLSGGQQQRVALARAIATEPGVLLFDEPLSNLDAVLREQMRFEIRSLQQRLGITGVYVTHSQDEALALSDRIAVMKDGVIVQQGEPLDLYAVPRTEFVATFIGLANILTLSDLQAGEFGLYGRLANGILVSAGAGRTTTGPGNETKAKISIRPVDIKLAVQRDGPGGSRPDANRLGGIVRSMAITGGLIDYFVCLEGTTGIQVRVQSTPPIAARIGDTVSLAFSPDRTVVLED